VSAVRAARAALRTARPYREVRVTFREGDLLAFRGKSAVSATIRALTGSVYSHVGLVYMIEGRRYCLEAVAKGVSLGLMSEVAKRYAGGIDYFEIGLAAAVRHKATLFALEQLGKPFDFRGLLRFFTLLALRIRARARLDRRWFCAELVAEAYRRQGFELVRSPSCYASPCDLAGSPHVRFVHTVKP
jgi:uncharacterized protein YycO